jgi:ketosteroid isomerase-like protein
VNNVETVQKIYEAFGRGDIAAILGHLTPDVEWEYGLVSTDVPWLQPQHGAGEVPRFFEALRALDFQRFEPKAFLESGDLVVVLVDFEATVASTRQRIVEEDEVHIWYFNAAGKVRRFRHRADTHQHWQACRAMSAV